MPWKECHVVDERLRFIARLLDGEKMAGLCREFGISRKTGYKIYTRYKDCGLEGLTDRSRRCQMRESPDRRPHGGSSRCLKQPLVADPSPATTVWRRGQLGLHGTTAGADNCGRHQ